MTNATEGLEKARGHLYDAGRALDGLTATVRAMVDDNMEAVRFCWMLQHPDEAAQAVTAAYDEFDGDSELWAEILRRYIDEAMGKSP